MNNCIVFDLDGTLIDSRKDLGNAINYMRKQHGLNPLNEDTITSYVGNGVTELVRRSISDSTSLDFDKCLQEMKAYYFLHSTDNTNCYSGVKEGLAKLKANGFILCVFTNKFTEAAIDILAKLDINQYFDEVIGSSSKFPLKPAPDAIFYLMDKYQSKRENTLIIGDHYTDLEAGRLAGCKRVFAAYGIGKTKNESFDFQVNSFSNFVEIMLSKK